jgi:hypothetical protein
MMMLAIVFLRPAAKINRFALAGDGSEGLAGKEHDDGFFTSWCWLLLLVMPGFFLRYLLYILILI